jgi:hypothetical protein
MMKVCDAKHFVVLGNALVKLLEKDEPDWVAVAVLVQDVIDHGKDIQNKLENQGVILVR